MLMPLERMRVGMSSESASQTQTPGPMAKNETKTNSKTAVSQPLFSLGHGRDERMVNFQRRVRGRVKIGKRILEKRRSTFFAGTQLSRVISIGLAAASSERTAAVAPLKIAVGINHDERGGLAGKIVAGAARLVSRLRD